MFTYVLGLSKKICLKTQKFELKKIFAQNSKNVLTRDSKKVLTRDLKKVLTQDSIKVPTWELKSFSHGIQK